MNEEQLEKVVMEVMSTKPQVVKVLKDNEGVSKGIAFIKYTQE